MYNLTQSQIHARSKNHTRFKRKHDEKFKKREMIKHAKYQKKVDYVINGWKKKGRGKEKKIKGQTLPSMISTNNKCTKSWKYIGYGKKKPLKEGLKHSAIFYLT